MGAHGSKEKLYRANSEKYPSKLPVPSDKKYKVAVNRERFGSFGARGNGKKRDSVAAPTPPPVRPPPTPPQPPAQVKKNGVVPKLSSSPVAVRARTSLAPPPSPRKPAARRTPAQRPNTLPTNNKEPPRVTAAVGPRSKRAPTPARATPALAPRETQAAALAHAAKGVEALGVLVQYLVFRLDALNGGSWRLEAERWRGVAAAERTSAERADHDRQQRAQKDLDTIAECLGKISELEMEVSSKEEANARLQAAHVNEVTALANDIKGLKETIDSLKREVAESRARLHAHSEIERTLRAQLEAARAEIERADSLRAAADSARAVSSTACNTVCDRADAACDPVCCEVEECQLRLSANEELSTDANELAAEVRSLRAVIELKQAEMASLRDARTELSAERERRAAAEREARAARHAAEELKERAAARQREADRLRDDNRRLRDAAARDRDQASRIAALNEELRYKLRQKSQVVSLLAGGGYMERVRARTSSGSSLRSASPESPPSPASPAPDAPALPAVKGVVEKHDSVSWVLEIEETPEEVASRLARRSSFRTTGSPLSSSGVKRRGGGGGSPGAGSPAPASPAPAASKLFRADLDFPPPPPPLKESAGEAIYIYDDASY
ncbi:myosin-2 heavy chain, non muscle isoform X2 [Leguminivora glycinivorella]|uniref:myosin-2 heavy chain, non muscle isoform X2 n=1 Tax=Leguminivora glycinivorella TaxID=1035111 RepID=UPI00200F71F8|nr:myosin-2 heavy chain, non muscle isoform X2 [Leguminivora glycinivorella]XP_047993208.1 myosin-2 heavy chain, non muscle isoform X2 [Leguminivora glycinivorella]